MAVNRRLLRNEILDGIPRDKMLRPRTKKFAEEVAKTVRDGIPTPSNPSPRTKTGPYATGATARTVKVERRRDRFRLPRYRVVSYSAIMNLLEDGTGIDAPGTHSPWGRFTETPDFAPFARAAFRHGGRPD